MKELTKRISQNTASFRVENIGARIVAGMLLVVVVVAVLAAPVAAVADSGDIAAGDIVIPDVCHSTWRWQVGFYGYAGIPYSQVKWTSNPCGDFIRDRSECVHVNGNTYDTDPSGIVKRVGLKARTYCHTGYDSLKRGEYQWKRPGGQWSAWKTFWKS